MFETTKEGLDIGKYDIARLCMPADLYVHVIRTTYLTFTRHMPHTLIKEETRQGKSETCWLPLLIRWPSFNLIHYSCQCEVLLCWLLQTLMNLQRHTYLLWHNYSTPGENTPFYSNILCRHAFQHRRHLRWDTRSEFPFLLQTINVSRLSQCMRWPAVVDLICPFISRDAWTHSKLIPFVHAVFNWFVYGF